MRSTLFLIPHQAAGLPVFGWGWLLAVLVVAVLVAVLWTARRGRAAVGRLIRDQGAVWTIAAVMIVLVLPRLELVGPTGEPVGIAVRGYGLFLMLAACASVGFAAWRAERAGLGADSILQLAPWTFAGGLVGARVFYVVQYYQDFLRDSWWETLASMAALTQGGLVVYGGFIGGFLASVWVVRRHRWPVWQLGDVIIPCVFVGLLFGRLGCLMNGCCYGGACEPGAMAVQFPPGSPVYREQMLTGELLGLVATPVQPRQANTRPGQRELRVRQVAANGLAASIGIRPGEEITLAIQPGALEDGSPDRPIDEILPGLAVLREGRLLAQWSAAELPAAAMPVWATQVISSVLALIACLGLLALERLLHWRGPPRPGVLMLVGFMLYAVLRIVLEWLRVDEAGQFGTALSISQWVSVLVFALSGITLAVRLTATAPAASPDQARHAA